MTIFQIIMLLAAAFFAYQVYVHIQNIDEDKEPVFMQETEVIELQPTPDELIAEADQAYMDGKLQRAQSLLEGIVEKHPDFAEGMNKLAFVLAKQGDKTNALKYYKASLEIDAVDDMTHNALATLLASMDRLQEAEEHYKRALEIDSDYELAWFNYANLMLRLERPEEAKKMYQKALEINPDFKEAGEELEKLG